LPAPLNCTIQPGGLTSPDAGEEAIEDAAGPSATLTGLLIVFGAAVLLVLPAIALLFTLAQRSVIEETGA
jgi:hypothetical protein